jgi:hypothetical protein
MNLYLGSDLTQNRELENPRKNARGVESFYSLHRVGFIVRSSQLGGGECRSG